MHILSRLLYDEAEEQRDVNTLELEKASRTSTPPPLLFSKVTEKELGFFLVAQIVKNQPAVPEIQVSSLGWEASLEKGLALCSQYSCQGNSMDRGAGGL